MEIRLLEPKEILKLMDFVWRVMRDDEDCNEFIQVGSSFFESSIKRKSFCYGAFGESNQLAAYYLIDIEGVKRAELANDLGVTREDLPNCAIISSFLVHPSCRGEGLQRIFTKMAEEEVKLKGFSHMLVTLKSNNTYAKRNFKADGYQYKFARMDPDNSIWEFYVKELTS